MIFRRNGPLKARGLEGLRVAASCTLESCREIFSYGLDYADEAAVLPTCLAYRKALGAVGWATRADDAFWAAYAARDVAGARRALASLLRAYRYMIAAFDFGVSTGRPWVFECEG